MSVGHVCGGLDNTGVAHILKTNECGPHNGFVAVCGTLTASTFLLHDPPSRSAFAWKPTLRQPLHLLSFCLSLAAPEVRYSRSPQVHIARPVWNVHKIKISKSIKPRNARQRPIHQFKISQQFKTRHLPSRE
jgi:hypothetical protein